MSIDHQIDTVQDLYTGTYSPEDNKLRLYAGGRLPPDTYATVRAHGFIYAPKQQLFVAPMWTPAREDLLITLCGEIADEDRSLVERAADRADRFAGYRASRTRDATNAQARVEQITSGIPLGQPILLGHHSEKHARRDQARIETGMRTAIRMWDTADYWRTRAAGVIRYATFKELPAVRARRIKTLQAEQRKHQRNRTEYAKRLQFWCMDPLPSRDLALRFTGNVDRAGVTLSDGTREHSAWSSLEDDKITVAEIAVQRRQVLPHWIAHEDRWIAHYDHRLLYEQTLLDAAGAGDLLAKKPKSAKALLPLCNYRAPNGLICQNPWRRHEPLQLAQIEMSAAEYAKIHTDYKATRIVDGSHRVRTAMRRSELSCVFLSDSKVHTPPAPVVGAEPRVLPAPRLPVPHRDTTTPERMARDRLTAVLGAGVQVIAVDQLFATPAVLASQLVDLVDIQPGDRVLEPSAGLGSLIGAMGGRMFGHPAVDVRTGAIVAVEIHAGCCTTLRTAFPLTEVIQAHFLAWSPIADQRFDRIVMNPPFVDGSDIRHIEHARQLLAPGGRLVAICAAGPRQQAKYRDSADTCVQWIALPPGSFAAVGTQVHTAIVVIDNPVF